MKTKTMQETSALREWLDMESKSFTALCGEPFTHFEVLSVMAACLAIIPMALLAEFIASWLAGGAA